MKLPSYFFFLLMLVACKVPTRPSITILTSQEKFYCDSLNIDSTIVLKLRTQTDSAIIPFPTDLQFVLDKDMDVDSNGKKINGFILNANNSNSDKIITELHGDFLKSGYTIFYLNRNFGIGNKSNNIGILKTTDKYQILSQVQTDGINWGIDTDSLINLIKVFDQKYSLQLIGASGDWCEFIINKEPENWMTLANEAYKVCPDIVDQGSQTIEKLTAEMKQTKRLYFWWD
jgi:hypothetical protein